MMRIKVHVEGIKGSARADEGQEPSALFNGVLEVDGHLIEEVTRIEAVFVGGDFTTVKPHLIPGSFEVVAHTKESWPELLKALEEQKKKVQAGTNRLIASREEE
jgi:hypothetical protein